MPPPQGFHPGTPPVLTYARSAIFGRGLSQRAAIQAVRQTGRNPYEAVIAAPLRGKNPLRVLTDLNNLLDACQQDE